jgi:hypothetical protein
MAFLKWANQDMIGLQSQLAYLHLANGIGIGRSFNQIQPSICQVERKTIWNKLQALATSKSPYSLIDLVGRGHTVNVAGSTLYVPSCYMVDVTPEDYPNCSMEIPVTYKNSTRFVNLITRNLQAIGQIIPCGSIMPVRWSVGEKWYCSYPQMTPCTAPEMIRPDSSSITSYGIITDGLGSDIFSPSQKQAHQDYKDTMESREGVLTKVTYTSAVSNREDAQLGSPLSTEDVNSMKDIIGSAITPFFWFFGSTTSTVIGIIIVVSVVKAFANVAIRAIKIYQKEGCSLKLLGSLWSSWFSIILLPYYIGKSLVKAGREMSDEANLKGSKEIPECSKVYDLSPKKKPKKNSQKPYAYATHLMMRPLDSNDPGADLRSSLMNEYPTAPKDSQNHV